MHQTVSWIHFGDLHISNEEDQNHGDFLELIEEANRFMGDGYRLRKHSRRMARQTYPRHRTRPEREWPPLALPSRSGKRHPVSNAFIWLIAAGAIAGVLFRPKEWPEAVWACLGAFLLVISGLLPLSQAGLAIAKGPRRIPVPDRDDVASELARREGVFDWLASLRAQPLPAPALREPRINGPTSIWLCSR